MPNKPHPIQSCLAAHPVTSASASADTPLPPEGHLVAINGIQMYYETYGAGSSLVLLHNFGESSAVWAPFVPTLAQSYHVIALDLRGHGHSTNPSHQFTHRQAALDVFALLDQIGIEQFRAIGASSGAMTLLHMATQQPGRVEAMVLMGGTHLFGPEARGIMRDLEGEPLSPEEWEYQRGIHKHGDDQILALRDAFCGFKDSYDDMNFTPPYLSTIAARTLIVHGDRDHFFPIRIPVEMYTAIPHAYLWIVPNGDHLPAFSPRVQAVFLRTSIEFLSGAWEQQP